MDRGPFGIPKAGVPYLSTEGYPYHLFHEVHADLAAAARQHSVAEAARELLERYVRGAVFARVAKLASLFRAVLSAEEIESALQDAVEADALSLVGKGRDRLVCAVLVELRGSNP